MTTAGNNSDERNIVEVLGLIGGVGVVLMQAAALIPGLLPLLILFLPLIVPLVVLGFAAAVVIAVPVGIWRLTARLRAMGARSASGVLHRGPTAHYGPMRVR